MCEHIPICDDLAKATLGRVVIALPVAYLQRGLLMRDRSEIDPCYRDINIFSFNYFDDITAHK